MVLDCLEVRSQIFGVTSETVGECENGVITGP